MKYIHTLYIMMTYKYIHTYIECFLSNIMLYLLNYYSESSSVHRMCKLIGHVLDWL